MMGGHWNHRPQIPDLSAFLVSYGAQCYVWPPAPHPTPHSLGVSLCLFWGLGTQAQCGFCPTSPSPAQLLASVPLQLDSNPLDGVANSAESSDLQGLHKLAFTAKCSPEKELGSGVGVAKHITSAAYASQSPCVHIANNQAGHSRGGAARWGQGELTGQPRGTLRRLRGTDGEGGTVLRPRCYDRTSLVFSKF